MYSVSGRFKDGNRQFPPLLFPEFSRAATGQEKEIFEEITLDTRESLGSVGPCSFPV